MEMELREDFHKKKDEIIHAIWERTIRLPIGQISTRDADFLIQLEIVRLLRIEIDLLREIAGKEPEETEKKGFFARLFS